MNTIFLFLFFNGLAGAVACNRWQQQVQIFDDAVIKKKRGQSCRLLVIVQGFSLPSSSLSLHPFPRKTTANEDIRWETNEATRAAADHSWIGLPVSFNSCGALRWSLWLRVMQNEGARLSVPCSSAPPCSLLAVEQTPTHKRGAALRCAPPAPPPAQRHEKRTRCYVALLMHSFIYIF